MANNNYIGQLNELGPTIRTDYTFTSHAEGFRCIVTCHKDKDIFETHGIGVKKQEAKAAAAQSMAATLKLVFPMVPLAIFSQVDPIDIDLTERPRLHELPGTIGFQLTEIKSGNLYVYINEEECFYKAEINPLPTVRLLNVECPLDLFNEPIRYTDWSQGPICTAQQNYVKRRIQLYLNSLR